MFGEFWDLFIFAVKKSGSFDARSRLSNNVE
jgi:hypothetical protein